MHVAFHLPLLASTHTALLSCFIFWSSGFPSLKNAIINATTKKKKVLFLQDLEPKRNVMQRGDVTLAKV